MGGEVWTLEVDRIRKDHDIKVRKIRNANRRLEDTIVDKDRQLADKDRQLADKVRQLESAAEGIIRIGRDAHFDDSKIISQLQKSLEISKEKAQAYLSEHR